VGEATHPHWVLVGSRDDAQRPIFHAAARGPRGADGSNRGRRRIVGAAARDLIDPMWGQASWYSSLTRHESLG
jgi:hypothetical protein